MTKNSGKDLGPTAAALLEIRGLGIEGQSGEVWQEIVKGIDLTLHRGEVLGLIGESGAGKSTLGLAAMGFVRDGCRITAGSIRFDGTDLVSASEAHRRRLRGRRIAYVAQSAAASFNPAHRLIDQYAEMPIAYGMMSRAEARRDAISLYRRMQLPNPEEIGFRYPHQVSGGQLQRAMTAMAMACRPDLIIFDEPTTALDVTTQIEVLSAIRDIVDQFNTAAIYISHDLAVVAQLANRVKVLLRGEEVEEQETRAMLSTPRKDYTRSLWAVRSHVRPAQPSPPEEETPIVEIRHVTAKYGTIAVLQDVSMTFHKRRTVAVVGESGSGKSTAARVVTGLLPPVAGDVLFNGSPLQPDYRRRSRDERRQIQMIHQMADTALNPKQRVREIVGWPIQFFLGLRGKALTERLSDLMRMIDLEPKVFLDRLPSELSGGQKQRIGIARALAAEPKFIICDEITSALDQLVAEGILNLLERLQSELELSFMFITHDIATVRAIADEVVVMKSGSVVESGPKDDILTPPHDPYTELLLSSVPEMDPDWLNRLLAERKAMQTDAS